jgi:adenylosuccinate synthase
MLNGVTKIAMTKIDVLNEFQTISVAESYIVDGRETSELPFELSDPSLEPVYTALPGWNMQTNAIRNRLDMPGPLSSYVSRIEKYLATPVHYVSVGPGRDELFLNH